VSENAWHDVLLVLQVPTKLYGSIGLSRRAELMYKPLEFGSLAELMADFKSGYR
jgi:asparagine synthetase A